MSVDDFTAKHRSLVSILGNGDGLYFVRCHCCHATSPACTSPDDLRILANAKTAGWAVVQVGETYRAYCAKPICQTQAQI